MFQSCSNSWFKSTALHNSTALHISMVSINIKKTIKKWATKQTRNKARPQANAAIARLSARLELKQKSVYLFHLVLTPPLRLTKETICGFMPTPLRLTKETNVASTVTHKSE